MSRLHHLLLRVALAACCAAAPATPAFAVFRTLFGPMPEATVIRNAPGDHNAAAMTYMVPVPGTPVGGEDVSETWSYWVVPCPTAYATWDMMTGHITHVYAPKVSFTAKTRVLLGDDKTAIDGNGKFKKLSAAEAYYACSQDDNVVTNLSQEGWAWLIAARGGWYALQVSYKRKAYWGGVDWNDSPEQIATELDNVSEDGAVEVKVLQDVTLQIDGNCTQGPILVNELDADVRSYHATTPSYAAADAFYNQMMKLSTNAQLLKSRGLEGACSPAQLADLDGLVFGALHQAEAALKYMETIDNANAAALDVLYNTLLATERCLVRGSIKTFSKIVQNFPPTAALYTVADAATSVATLTKTGTGLTMMEFGVQWADAKLLEVANGGQDPTGCAANVVGSICRIATDALWNKSVLNLRIDNTTGTVNKLDTLLENLRPGRALPASQRLDVVASTKKGWGGLGNLIQHKTNWCAGYRQLYFSTFATVFKDFYTVADACGADYGKFPKAFETIKGLAVVCSGVDKSFKTFFPPTPPPTAPPTMPPMPPLH